MSHRWRMAGLVALTLLAGACERGGRGQDARPQRGLPSSMAALGDSITAGYASCRTYVACRDHSWSTGGDTAVDSHYRRIRADRAAIAGDAVNLAVPGARAEALAEQAAKAVQVRVEYVTVLIGANDACRARVSDMTSVAAFRADVDAGLDRLRRGLPRARVLVVSIPDIHRLWQLGHDDDRAVRAWSRGVCPSMLANPRSDAPADVDRRAQVDDRVTAFNRELSRACRAYGDRCRYDGGAAHRVRFTAADVSPLDWFHPSAAGQNRLAEATFPDRFNW